MKMLKAAFVAAAVSIVPVQSAVARDLGAIYTDCGLGGLIAQKTPWLAVTTNIVWDLGTTATSSDLSTPESCKGGKPAAAALIYQAYPVLERELAQGRGEHLDALLAIADCDEGARAQVVSALRTDFGSLVNAAIYPQQSRLEQADGLYQAFTGQVEGSFAGSCNLA